MQSFPENDISCEKHVDSCFCISLRKVFKGLLPVDRANTNEKRTAHSGKRLYLPQVPYNPKTCIETFRYLE